MKHLKNILQFALGIGIICYLFFSIHKGTLRVDLETSPVSVNKDTVCQLEAETTTNLVTIIDTVKNGTLVSGHLKYSRKLSIPQKGRMIGPNGEEIRWTASKTSRYGLNLFKNTVAGALENWIYLLAAFLVFGVCLAAVITRWRILLDAQDLHVPLGRLIVLYMVGHFFNAFMFGATGGDVVKAYLVTKETPEKKTAAVTTVFIDRIVGLITLIIIVVAVMFWRLDFFFEQEATRKAFFFYLALAAVCAVGMAIVFGQDLFDKIPAFKKMKENTGAGRIISKVYDSFHACFTNKLVFLKTFLCSIVNHTGIVVISWYLGKALGINLTFVDYLSVMPIVNTVGALPLTPGGLGTRDAASVYLLSAIGVSTANALSISLMTYMNITLWSLLGGIFYFFYIYRRGEKIPEEVMEESEIEDIVEG